MNRKYLKKMSSIDKDKRHPWKENMEDKVLRGDKKEKGKGKGK